MADDADPSPLTDAADRIRETAKWLTVSLGSLGAILVAGSQLSSVGDLAPGSGRFWLAVGSAAVAVGVTVAILGFVIWVATTPARDLDGLTRSTPRGAEHVVTSKTHLAPYASLAALNSAWAAAVAEQTRAGKVLKTAAQAAQSAVQAEAESATDPAKAKAQAQAATAAKTALAGAQSEMNQANADVRFVRDAGEHLLEVVGYANVAGRWTYAAKWTLGLGVLAAIAVGAFAWAANPPEDAKGTAANPAVVGKATSVTVTLTDQGREALEESLGTGCDLDKPMSGVLLGKTDAGADVLIDNDPCEPVRFVAGPGWAAVEESAD